MSEWMRRWVDKVDERLNTFPHTLQPKLRSCTFIHTNTQLLRTMLISLVQLIMSLSIIRLLYLSSTIAADCSEAKGHVGDVCGRGGCCQWRRENITNL